MRVADLMTRHVEFIEPNASTQDAASLMGELDVSALPLGSPEDLRGLSPTATSFIESSQRKRPEADPGLRSCNKAGLYVPCR
jgi:CBS-domain-containing membrane protein